MCSEYFLFSPYSFEKVIRKKGGTLILRKVELHTISFQTPPMYYGTQILTTFYFYRRETKGYIILKIIVFMLVAIISGVSIEGNAYGWFYANVTRIYFRKFYDASTTKKQIQSEKKISSFSLILFSRYFKGIILSGEAIRWKHTRKELIEPRTNLKTIWIGKNAYSAVIITNRNENVCFAM